MPVPAALDLVVIMITPSLALAPYNADAAAPLNTVMVSISSGLILVKPSPPSDTRVLPLSVLAASDPLLPGLAPKLVLSIGTPFTTIKGWFWPPTDDCPRIRILLVPAGPVPR